jgi:hypothetical protein
MSENEKHSVADRAVRDRWVVVDGERRYTIERIDGRWVVSRLGEMEVVGYAKADEDPTDDWQLRRLLLRRYKTKVQERFRARNSALRSAR